MDRKNLPLVLMLTAGAITCIINLVRGYSLFSQLVTLFAVLVVFYILGSILKGTLDLFDRQNEQRAAEEGEVIEKEAEPEEQDNPKVQEGQEE